MNNSKSILFIVERNPLAILHTCGFNSHTQRCRVIAIFSYLSKKQSFKHHMEAHRKHVHRNIF